MNGFANEFYRNFIEDNRWQYLFNGLMTTIGITIVALVIGMILGFFLAVVRATHDLEGRFTVLNGIVKVYLTIIRGTPIVVQLLVIYFVIFSSVPVNKIFVAIFAFGLNSAAYVAEIVRSGIMSIEKGQMEAGRSLGFTYSQTMIKIILPQAIKNVLPALANEGIALLKETSVSGFIAIQDLTKSGDIIRSITYSSFMPLIAVALIYLLLVMAMTAGVNKLERRLKVSEQ